MKIEEIDKNLKVETKIEEKDLQFISVKENPFDLYGFCGDSFARLPMSVAEKVNDGVKNLSTNTAGGRVRFKTDSPYVAISAKFPTRTKFPHMPDTGVAGFDMYVKTCGGYEYVHTFIPPCGEEKEFEGIHYFKDRQMRELTVDFPLYNDVSELYIGLAADAAVEHGGTYKNKKPIVYYGSSITQGGCASRPGNSYQAIISRRYDYDYINLGFSGSALGEKIMAEYIADLDMSCFVMDYDHNAPDYKHLQKTHLNFYKIIREKNPEIDIILMTMPKCTVLNDVEERKAVIRATYDYALKNGDKHIYFVDGGQMSELYCGDSWTVDGIHPNDLGFMCMANTVSAVIEKCSIK